MRIEAFQLDAGIRGCELPIGLGLVFVAAVLPGGNLLGQRFLIGNAAIQALRRQDTQLGFRHIQPAAVLGRVVPFEALHEPPGFGRRECLVKRGFGVRVQIVLNQNDLFGVREVDVR